MRWAEPVTRPLTDLDLSGHVQFRVGIEGQIIPFGTQGVREVQRSLTRIRSSASVFARERIFWFITAGMLGIGALFLFQKLKISDTLCASQSLSALEFAEKTILPRTGLDFPQILRHRGCTYEVYTIVLDVLISALCAIGMTLSLLDAKKFPVDHFQRPTNITLMTTKEFSISCLISLVTLVFSPPEFNHPSSLQSYVDPIGLFFLKEGAFIAIGYYNLNIISINVFLSLFRVNRVFLP